MFFSDRFKRTNTPKSNADTNEVPLQVMIEQRQRQDRQDKVIALMSLSRKQRRQIGRANKGVKIPGLAKPYVKPKEKEKGEYEK